MRRKLIASLMFMVFLLFFLAPTTILPNATELKDYYMQHFISDTGAYNAVTGIYLNYRVFDTMFESLLLLVSVIGVIYFSRHEGDY